MNFQFKIPNKIKFYSAGLGLSPALCQSNFGIISLSPLILWHDIGDNGQKLVNVGEIWYQLQYPNIYRLLNPKSEKAKQLGWALVSENPLLSTTR